MMIPALIQKVQFFCILWMDAFALPKCASSITTITFTLMPSGSPDSNRFVENHQQILVSSVLASMTAVTYSTSYSLAISSSSSICWWREAQWLFKGTRRTNWWFIPNEQVPPPWAHKWFSAMPSPAFPERCQSRKGNHTTLAPGTGLSSGQADTELGKLPLLLLQVFGSTCHGCQLGTLCRYCIYSHKGTISCRRRKESIFLLIFHSLGQISLHGKLMHSISRTILHAKGKHSVTVENEV